MTPSMTPRPIVEVHKLKTAEELLGELSPGTGSKLMRFTGTASEWAFRGHANECGKPLWRLTPSALRADAFVKHSIAAGGHSRTAREQREREVQALMDFAEVVDLHGLLVPGDHPRFRDRRRAAEPMAGLHNPFPPLDVCAMVALAQHHGIPTRMLDWSRKPLVAAYFACSDVAQRRKKDFVPPADEPPFCVFALRKEAMEATHRGGLDPAIFFITVPTATNSYLHAQGGLFTLVQPIKVDEHPCPALDDVLRRHEATIAALAPGTFTHFFPLLVEFQVPAREARTLLRLLANEGMTAAAVKPALAGCVEALEERRFHQKAEPDFRS